MIGQRPRCRPFSSLPILLYLTILLILSILLTTNAQSPPTLTTSLRKPDDPCSVKRLFFFDVVASKGVEIPSRGTVCIDSVTRATIQAITTSSRADCQLSFYWKGRLIGVDEDYPYFVNKDRRGRPFGTPISTLEGRGEFCVDPNVGEQKCVQVNFSKCKIVKGVNAGGDIKFKIIELTSSGRPRGGGIVREVVAGMAPICPDDFRSGEFTVLAEPNRRTRSVEFSTPGYKYTDKSVPFSVAGEKGRGKYRAFEAVRRSGSVPLRGMATTYTGQTFERTVEIPYQCPEGVVKPKSTGATDGDDDNDDDDDDDDDDEPEKTAKPRKTRKPRRTRTPRKTRSPETIETPVITPIVEQPEDDNEATKSVPSPSVMPTPESFFDNADNGTIVDIPSLPGQPSESASSVLTATPESPVQIPSSPVPVPSTLPGLADIPSVVVSSTPAATTSTITVQPSPDLYFQSNTDAF